MGSITNCIIESKFRKAAAALDTGTLHFTAPNGAVTVFAGKTPGPVADFQVHDWDVLRQAASRGCARFCQSAHFTVRGAFAGKRWLHAQRDGLARSRARPVDPTAHESGRTKKKPAQCAG